jgi:hypothetical protein
MREITRFIRWANRKRPWRRLICHFYIAKSRKQYYSTTDYAYFNLFDRSPDWLVKGTPEHGITSRRGKRSAVPCLNCFEIDEEFYEGLRTVCDEGNERFELGIIFNKRKLKNHFGEGKIIDVTPIVKPPSPYPPPKKCHLYDWRRSRRKLWPFHKCNVVRVEIRPSRFHKIPIEPIPYHIIMGLLVKNKDYSSIELLLEAKRWDEIEVFPLL